MLPGKIREHGGRGLRLVEQEYKAIKIKGALKLYKNKDPTMNLKEVTRFSSSLGLELNLNYPTPSCCTKEVRVRVRVRVTQRSTQKSSRR